MRWSDCGPSRKPCTCSASGAGPSLPASIRRGPVGQATRPDLSKVVVMPRRAVAAKQAAASGAPARRGAVPVPGLAGFPWSRRAARVRSMRRATSPAPAARRSWTISSGSSPRDRRRSMPPARRRTLRRRRRPGRGGHAPVVLEQPNGEVDPIDIGDRPVQIRRHVGGERPAGRPASLRLGHTLAERVQGGPQLRRLLDGQRRPGDPNALQLLVNLAQVQARFPY